MLLNLDLTAALTSYVGKQQTLPVGDAIPETIRIRSAPVPRISLPVPRLSMRRLAGIKFPGMAAGMVFLAIVVADIDILANVAAARVGFNAVVHLILRNYTKLHQ
jgi:hypothetical protein